MNIQQTRKPSSFISGFTSLNASYVLTVLTNHPAIELIKARDTNFIKTFVEKLVHESKKVDDGRNRWRDHDFIDDLPMIEANILAGWPFVINLAMTTATIDLLEEFDPQSVKVLTDKLVSSIEYLERKFPAKMYSASGCSARVEVQAPVLLPVAEVIPEVPSIETPAKPKRIRKPAAKKTATKAKAKVKKAKPFNLELIGDGNTAPDSEGHRCD